MGWLESELCLVGRIGSGVQVSASFQIFALRMFLHSAGVTSGGFFLGVIYGGMSKGIAGDITLGNPATENPPELFAIFDQQVAISQTIRDSAIITIEGE